MRARAELLGSATCGKVPPPADSMSSMLDSLSWWPMAQGFGYLPHPEDPDGPSGGAQAVCAAPHRAPAARRHLQAGAGPVQGLPALPPLRGPQRHRQVRAPGLTHVPEGRPGGAGPVQRLPALLGVVCQAQECCTAKVQASPCRQALSGLGHRCHSRVLGWRPCMAAQGAAVLHVRVVAGALSWVPWAHAKVLARLAGQSASLVVDRRQGAGRLQGRSSWCTRLLTPDSWTVLSGVPEQACWHWWLRVTSQSGWLMPDRCPGAGRQQGR